MESCPLDLTFKKTGMNIDMKWNQDSINVSGKLPTDFYGNRFSPTVCVNVNINPPEQNKEYVFS